MSSQPLTTAEDERHQREPSASVSPPPPPPIAITPGPRASRFQQVYSEALMRTIRANSYENFAACFPTPARHVPRSLESVWRQLNAKLEEGARAEFVDIVRERDVVKGLNELDRLIAEARVRRENHHEGEGGEESVPPHALGAEELYQAHLAPYLVQTQSSLDSKLNAVQKENLQLAERIERQRGEIQQFLSTLNAVVSDIEGAVKAMHRFDSEGRLRKDAEMIDNEITAAAEIVAAQEQKGEP